MHGGTRHVARLAHVAAHGAHGHDELGQVVGVVDAGRGSRHEEAHLVILAHSAGQIADGLGRGTADFAGPFRRFRRVVVGALHVVLEVRLLFSIGRHMLGIEAHGAAVQEVPVNEALSLVGLQHGVGHAEQEGHVGGRANGNPLRIQGGRRLAVHGINDDELRAGGLGLPVVPHLAARSAPGRVHSHHDDGLAVAQVVTVVDSLVLHVVVMEPDDERSLRPGAIGVGVPEVREAAEGAHGAGHLGIPTLQEQDGAVAILLLGASQALSHQIERLVPAHTLPLVLAAQLAIGSVQAPAGALERILDAILGEHLLALAAAAQAPALLRIVRTVLVGVVGLLAHDNAVLHKHLVQAATTAVVPAGRRLPLA